MSRELSEADALTKEMLSLVKRLLISRMGRDFLEPEWGVSFDFSINNIRLIVRDISNYSTRGNKASGDIWSFRALRAPGLPNLDCTIVDIHVDRTFTKRLGLITNYQGVELELIPALRAELVLEDLANI